MIQFKDLVYEFVENEGQPQTQANPASSRQFDNVVNFLTGEPLERFSKAFSQKYSIPPLDKTNFTTLISVINKSANQANYVQGDFERFADVFPYIDFVTYVVQEATDNDKPIFNKWDENAAEKAPAIVNAYIDLFNQRAPENSWTLDYPPVTARALILGTDLRKKRYESVIGELTLSNYQNKSLQFTIFSLLAARKKIRTRGENKNPQDVPYIREILLHPEKYAGGNIQVPEQFSQLYNATNVKQIMSLGVSIRKLFDYEKALVEQQLNKDESATNEITTTIDEFFDNSSLEQSSFKWKYKTTKGQASLDLASKQPTFDETYNALLETQGELFGSDTNFSGNLSNKPVAISKPVFGKTTNNTPQETNPLIGPKNGYTISTIKNMKNVNAAVELYKKLEDFSSYIREQEPVDWVKHSKEILGGMRDVAQGLSMGVPDPGAAKR